MNITFFHWAQNSPPSITRSFNPLITELKKNHNVKVFHVPYSGGNPINILRNILFVYKHRDKTGINHITGDIHYCILGLIGVKSVLTIHDDYAIKKASNLLNKIYKYIFWIYLPIKLATKTVFISEATQKKINKLIKVPSGVVIANHTVDSEFQYTPQKFHNENPTILQIGTSEQKNLETTLKVISQLNIPCTLRVIKKMTPQQHQMAKDLHINYSNAFNLSDSEIIEEYKNADVIAFPSLYEGFGMPIIEGQATGRVVITTNASPMKDVAGKNGAILLNNPLDDKEYKNKLKEVISNEELRTNLIQNGLINAAQYTIQKVTSKYINFYKQIL